MKRPILVTAIAAIVLGAVLVAQVPTLSRLVDNAGIPLTYTTADPCEANPRTFQPISTTANVQLVAGTSAKRTYICEVFLIPAAAESISLTEGTGTTCATSTAPVIGATTAANGMSLAATGGFVLGTGSKSIAATAVNANNLCLFNSGSTVIAGVIATVQQ